MGCCNSNPDEFNLNDNFVYSIETTLNVLKISYNLFFVQCQRNSSGDLMTYSEFKSFCEILKIPSTSKDAKIMSSLRDASAFSIPVYRILTYHIVFTGGSKEEKVDQLFRVYDFRSTGRLHEEEIRLMVTTIFQISVEALLKFAALSAEKIGSESHSSYYSSIMKVRSTVISYLFHQFMDKRKYVNLVMFNSTFFTIEMNVLLVPRLLRKFCFRLSLEQREVGIEEARKLQIDQTINNEMIKRF